MAKQASTVRQRQPSKQPTGVAEQQVREACSAVPYPPPGKGSTEYQLPPHRDSEVDSLSAVQATSPDDDADYKYHGLTPAVYYCWQYSGAVLALTSLAGIITDKYEEDDPWVTRRLIAYLLILLVALFAHESRPYKVQLPSKNLLLLGIMHTRIGALLLKLQGQPRPGFLSVHHLCLADS